MAILEFRRTWDAGYGLIVSSPTGLLPDPYFEWITAMFAIENIKVGDRVGVEYNPPTRSASEAYIGTVTKVTKTKIEVSVANTTFSFKVSTGRTQAQRWDISHELVEITQDFMDRVIRRRRVESVTKKLKDLSLKDLHIVHLEELEAVLDKISPKG